ncbi:MAG: RNA methyltransferase [Bacteroidetes bacterium]|nr:RNA methyltransferase [Bacteroidota bacterium]MDA0922225.1 RNA methyltransferase [Bacteroidota bacterium]MDA1287872.1 RNA methyltransferase [Bacteroidota bacterium]
MVSKNQRKQIQQLKQKKYRQLYRKFVAEGDKVVQEFLDSGWTCDLLCAQHPEKYPNAIPVDALTMKQLTHFTTPSPVLAVFDFPQLSALRLESVTLVLEGIRDPGNLGTILRLCDWFGLSQLLCSSDTVDCFNAKTVQASMGSLARVSCHYIEELPQFLSSQHRPVFGADLNGKSLYSFSFPSEGIYVFGSESHGLSKAVSGCINDHITIPNFRKGKGPESLNVATASAIFLSELFRGR